MERPTKPFFQTLLRWIAFVLVGILSFGALLDAISNAVSVITPRVTYVSSAALLVLWLLIELFAALFGIAWLVEKSSYKIRVRGLGPRLRLGLVGILVLLWIPRLGDLPEKRRDIPLISIAFVNIADTDIKIARRGEFVLWLPTALYDGTPRRGGRFVLSIPGDHGYLDTPITIKKGAQVRVSAKLLRQDIFIEYLEREDTDLSLVASTSEGSSSSPNIPFTRAALTSRYFEWKIPDSFILPPVKK